MCKGPQDWTAVNLGGEYPHFQTLSYSLPTGQITNWLLEPAVCRVLELVRHVPPSVQAEQIIQGVMHI